MASPSLSLEPQILNFAVVCMVCKAHLRGDPASPLISHGLGPCCEDSYRAACGLPPRRLASAVDGGPSRPVGSVPLSALPCRSETTGERKEHPGRSLSIAVLPTPRDEDGARREAGDQSLAARSAFGLPVSIPDVPAGGRPGLLDRAVQRAGAPLSIPAAGALA